jgi:pimeloyl-ACP methyl ester carboxylesterase
MSTLAYTRIGAGEPLVLLPALGLSRSSWDPVLAELSERFEVLAVDLPGFGDSPPLDPRVEPEPAELARSVAGLLDELGIDEPLVRRMSAVQAVAAVHAIGTSPGFDAALEPTDPATASSRGVPGGGSTNSRRRPGCGRCRAAATCR